MQNFIDKHPGLALIGAFVTFIAVSSVLVHFLGYAALG